MKKSIAILFVMSFFSFVYAQETEEPVTNEDKMEENSGKEEAAAPAVADNSAGESKFNKFMNRKGKKALAGLKGGMNISHFWGDDLNDSNPGVGYFFGAFFEYAFIKNLSLQAELNFTDKGDDDFSWEYFEIPVIAQGIIPVNDMIWINAGLGLYVAFAYANPGFLGLGRNVVDGGMVMKAGLEINTKVGVFVGDLRYSLGFAEVWDNTDVKNGAFSILVGYAVPLPF
ncbi:MAG TPA: outer membrane beta-barrel protein [bacterium]|nr:outer membrane beta-barrel protein [bacterium]